MHTLAHANIYTITHTHTHIYIYISFSIVTVEEGLLILRSSGFMSQTNLFLLYPCSLHWMKKLPEKPYFSMSNQVLLVRNDQFHKWCASFLKSPNIYSVALIWFTEQRLDHWMLGSLKMIVFQGITRSVMWRYPFQNIASMFISLVFSLSLSLSIYIYIYIYKYILDIYI